LMAGHPALLTLRMQSVAARHSGRNRYALAGQSSSVQTVRSVLHGLRWRADRDFGLVEVDYVHRGAPGDTRKVGGADILELGPWMIVIKREGMLGGPAPGRAAIPYHRIVQVRYDGGIVFDRLADRGRR
jgi:uncharacterized protein (UPF0248 family)